MTASRRPHLTPGRHVGVWVARATVVALAVMFTATAELADGHPVGFEPLLHATTLAGFAFVIVNAHAGWCSRWCDLTRGAWLVLLTMTGWGRALFLLHIGLPELERSREIIGACGWAVAFFAGICASLILTADRLLRE